MRKLSFLALACLVTACETSPSNLQGNSFDADSAYCRQLWRSATTLYQNSANLPATRATNPNISLHAAVPQMQLTNSKKAYDKDCESLSAYKARTAKS